MSSPDATLLEPGQAFDGNPSSGASSTGSITWNCESFGIVPTKIEWMDRVDTNGNSVQFVYESGGFDTIYSNNTQDWVFVSNGRGEKLTAVYVLNHTGGYSQFFYGIKINDQK